MEQLDVYLCGKLAGMLRRDSNGAMTFRYLPDYIVSDNATPVSGTLPLGLAKTWSRTQFRDSVHW